MLSYLPLIFADGLPSCLDKLSLKQLEKFVNFMTECSVRLISEEEKLFPDWWPSNLPFSIPVVLPEDPTEGWLPILRSLVYRCYTYHGCDYLLDFSLELSEIPLQYLKFVSSWDGNTSVYCKKSGKLLVSFRNENMYYDRKRDSPRKSLLPRPPSTIQQMMVQPNQFDIYLCENCGGEFSTYDEVKIHEKICETTIEGSSNEDSPDEQISESCVNQTTFLTYFNLEKNGGNTCKPLNSPEKKRIIGGVNFNRCYNIPFSSPLGITLHKRMRPSTFSPIFHIERFERYCTDRVVDFAPRSRESRSSVDQPQWPVTWKRNIKKGEKTSGWTHQYQFNMKWWQWKKKRLSNKDKLKNQLKLGRKPLVVVKKLTEEDIKLYTSKNDMEFCDDGFQLQVMDDLRELSSSYVDYMTRITAGDIVKRQKIQSHADKLAKLNIKKNAFVISLEKVTPGLITDNKYDAIIKNCTVKLNRLEDTNDGYWILPTKSSDDEEEEDDIRDTDVCWNSYSSCIVKKISHDLVQEADSQGPLPSKSNSCYSVLIKNVS